MNQSVTLMTLIALLDTLKMKDTYETPRLAMRFELDGLSEVKRALDLVTNFNLIRYNYEIVMKIQGSTVFLHFK